MTLSLLLGILIGAVMGLTGAGGGILAVPALVAGMGWSMQQAAPVALIAVSGGAALGAAEAWRRRLVRYRAAFLIAAIALPFTALGLRLAQVLPQRVLLVLFAWALLMSALRSAWKLRHAQAAVGAPGALGRINPDTGRFHWNWPTAFLFAAIGAIAGFMTGLLGVGGGFVIVPLLQRFTNVSMHGVVATTLLVIALVGGSGVVMALGQGATLPWPATALFAFATAAGLLLARWGGRRLDERHVQAGFAAVLVGVALWLLARAAQG